jgi:RNA polymerase sigma-70 factor (ECF subfamily)
MAGTEELIERLYRERYAGFRDALAPLVGDREAAHDVVQEAFAIALRNAKQLRRDDAVAAWVWRIAYRLALQTRRTARSEFELPADLTVLEPDRYPELAAAVRSLPPKRRLVVFLRYYADFTYQEIAEALDIRVGTVSATLVQAHAALLDQIAHKEVAT